MITSNQSNDIPMAGKTVIVTGANRGIGAVITREIARLGAKIIMACRSTDLAEVTRNQILAEIGYGKLEVRKLDLENQSSIKSFASAFLKDHSRLDVLINNAGLQVPERKSDGKGRRTDIRCQCARPASAYGAASRCPAKISAIPHYKRRF